MSRREAAARVYYFARSPITDSLRAFLRSVLDRLPESTLHKYTGSVGAHADPGSLEPMSRKTRS